MTNYTLGATYTKNRIDTLSELIPQNAAFKSVDGEKMIFEERENKVSSFQLASAIESGTITALDKEIISLAGIFASAACTSKVLLEMLTMMGVDVNKNTLDSSIKRLHRYHLINLSRFKSPDGRQSNVRIITLMSYGSQLAKSLGIPHRFNPIATASAAPYTVKSRTETAHLICNWLKNMPVEWFKVRPVKVVDAEAGAIVRPAAAIRIWEETLYFEVPRRHDGWLEDLIGKLLRYELVFKDEAKPTIVINGEDAEMNFEIFNALKSKNLTAEVMYTDDLAMFGAGFKRCLYTFDCDGKQLCFDITDTERGETNE